jgi:hypothetical protein
MACKSINVCSNHLGHAIRPGRVRKPFQLEDDHTSCAKPVANCQFTKVSVRRYEDTVLGFCDLENCAVRNSGE